MRPIQEIFNAVIDSGYYSEDQHPYMCVALLEAKYNGIVTAEEMYLAEQAIQNLLTVLAEKVVENDSLRECIRIYLQRMDKKFRPVPSIFDVTLSIYRDWDNAMNIINDLIAEE